MHDQQMINEWIKNEEKEKLERFLDQMLEQNPGYLEGWLQLGTLVMVPGIADYEKSLFCFEKALALDENHMDALVLLGATHHLTYGFIEDQVMERISRAKPSDKEYESMLWLIRAWGFETNGDPVNHEKALLYSVKACPSHVLNHVNLALLYKEKGELPEAIRLLSTALDNIQAMYDIGPFLPLKRTYPIIESPNLIDYKEFINERVKGIHVTDLYINNLEREIEELEKMVK